MQHLPLDLRPGPVRATVRPAGAVDHAGLAELAVAVGPPLGCGDADLVALRGTAQWPAVIHDTLSELQAAAFGQGCVSVGHEDLRASGCGSSSTLTRRSSPSVDLQSRVPVTNLCGQYT